MGRLAGLLSNGIGLAMEAASSNGNGKPTTRAYDSSTYERSNALQSPQISRRSPAYEDSRQDFPRSVNYQDYSNDDIDVKVSIEGDCETVPDSDSRDSNKWRTSNDDSGEYSIQQSPRMLPSTTLGRLIRPVIIPQRRPEDKSRGWLRAYAPALMDCGIDQDEFIYFLDSFNEASKSSPYLDVVNIAALGVGFAPGITPMIVSMAVPVATRFAKQAQTKHQSGSFLDKANAQLFAPHGLFAMVMTFKPDDQSQVLSVDTSSTSPRAMQGSPFSPMGNRGNVQPAQHTTYGEFQLPPSAPLIFPDAQPSSSDQPKNSLAKMGDFVADYNDRRAQARYAQANPSSALSVGPAPTFASRFGDPSYASNRSQDKSDRKALKHQRKADKKGGRHGLIGGARGMLASPGGAQTGAPAQAPPKQGLLKSLKGMGMQNDVLYLMIVNKPSQRDTDIANERAALAARMSSAPRQEYRPQLQFQSLEWAAERNAPVRRGVGPVEGYGRDDYGSRLGAAYGAESDLPPRYTPRAGSGAYARREEPLYCVPTL
ncbi:hypothetical protein MMC11_006824 [Xylographa trunciseda]|nr:hypothetical protein [Xylographa trunciseda]